MKQIHLFVVLVVLVCLCGCTGDPTGSGASRCGASITEVYTVHNYNEFNLRSNCPSSSSCDATYFFNDTAYWKMGVFNPHVCGTNPVNTVTVTVNLNHVDNALTYELWIDDGGTPKYYPIPTQGMNTTKTITLGAAGNTPQSGFIDVELGFVFPTTYDSRLDSAYLFGNLSSASISMTYDKMP